MSKQVGGAEEKNISKDVLLTSSRRKPSVFSSNIIEISDEPNLTIKGFFSINGDIYQVVPAEIPTIPLTGEEPKYRLPE